MREGLLPRRGVAGWRRALRLVLMVCGAAALVLAGVGGWYGLRAALGDGPSPGGPPGAQAVSAQAVGAEGVEGGGGGRREVAPRGPLGDDERATIEVFERASPSVVYITSLSRVSVRRGFSMDVLRIPQGTGSGFVWDSQGHIVTNYHVIQGASEAEVAMGDQSKWPARIVGVDPDHDLAVLRVEAPPELLRPIALGASSDLRVGQKALAIGNPFGLDQTLTTGVISALDREIEGVSGRTIYGVIQTDAAINPGNSGGPLLDSAGRIIGVNTAIQSPSGAYAGIGFAVPIDTAARLIPELIEHGRAARPGLGVQFASPHMAARFGVRGVLLRQVLPGSAADRAGLRPMHYDDRGRLRTGDILVAVDGTRVSAPDDIRDVLNRHAVGDVVEVTVAREGRAHTLSLPLQADP